MSKYPGRIVTDLAPAGYSVYFDGNGDYLSAASNAAFAFGTGDFTIEAWINPASLATDTLLCGTDATNGAILGYSATTVWLGSRQVSYDLTATYAIPLNTWTHIAVSRQGTTARIFANGVQIASGTVTNNYAQGQFAIGNYTFTNIGVVGYLSNVRAVKGTALYTAAFNPPTQLFNITNTSILTCNSPAFVDQSSNAFSLTAAGTPFVSTFTPFRAYVPYNPALGASTPGVWTLDEALQARATRQWNMYDPSFNLTTLLLHGNGTNGAQNNTFLDSSSNSFTITRNGNTTQGSFSPFSQTGWSNFFGSSTANLKFASNAAFAVGNSNFTVECFVNFTAWASTNQRIFVQGQSGTDNLTIQRDSGANNLVVNIQGSSSISYAWSPNIGQWYHIAVVKSGTGTGQVAVYIDGVSVATGTSSTSISQNQVLIGGIDWASSYNMQGYISNLRYTIGAALYTSNFTPSTTPLTTTSQGATASQVELLTCQSNSFIDNSSNGFSMTVNGTTSVQPFSPFYSTTAYTPQTIGGSAYLDGSGDNLVSASLGTSIGTGDYCLEAWVYTTNAATSFVASLVLNNSSGYIIYLQVSANTVRFLDFQNPNTNFVISGGTINSNEWVHIVGTRQSGNMRAFVNGRLAAYQASVNFNYGTAGTVEVPPSVAQYVSGVRVNIGSVPTSYQTSSTTTGTQIFTPPTAPTTTTSQGATAGNVRLLLNMTNAGIVDSTGKNALETVGNAQISTTQSKFGGSSMYFDGTGDYLISNSGTDLYAFGSGDFTIEMWVNFAVVGSSGVYTLYDSRPNGTQGAYASIALDRSTAKIYYYVSSAIRITGSVTIVANTWYHVAICRSGTSTRLFVNGTQDGSTWTDTTTYLNPANRPVIAASGSSIGTEATNGYIDELRVTRGVARYTGNFTPQTSQWQDE